jgi:phosphoribosylaminoimidazole carboxylase PurE protein
MARKKSKPLVGVVLGSHNDLETMRRCVEQLEAFGIPYELRVISAHRSPDVAHEYAATAVRRGLKVIIAGAGMSATLAGVLASKTHLPVIGVPVSSGPLAGVDAFVSTIQMPPGVPVGCMSIGAAGASNAGIYAAEMLAITDGALAKKLVDFKKSQAEVVAQRDAEVRTML